MRQFLIPVRFLSGEDAVQDRCLQQLTLFDEGDLILAMKVVDTHWRETRWYYHHRESKSLWQHTENPQNSDVFTHPLYMMDQRFDSERFAMINDKDPYLTARKRWLTQSFTRRHEALRYCKYQLTNASFYQGAKLERIDLPYLSLEISKDGFEIVVMQGQPRDTFGKQRKNCYTVDEYDALLSYAKEKGLGKNLSTKEVALYEPELLLPPRNYAQNPYSSNSSINASA